MVDRSRSATPKGSLALAGLAAALAAGCGTANEPAESAQQPTVLLISIDTLRADALSCYGNPRLTSPVLDALAADGALFREALAHAPSTAPSHASLFTGVTPWTHRVTNVARGGQGFFKLLPEFDTLAESFAARGYHTAAFTDGGPFNDNWALGQGFELHDNAYEGVEAKVDKLLGHLDATADDARPRLLFLHTYEVHQPFLPPVDVLARFRSDPDYDGIVRERELELRAMIAKRGTEGALRAKHLVEDSDQYTAADVAYLWDLYVAGVAHTDHELGRLFDGLRERGLYDELYVVVTSDHGEEFGEHGSFGHSQLHPETLRVPLILRPPASAAVDWRGRVVEQRVGHVDLHATLLEVADAPATQSTGRSLFEGLRRGAFEQRAVFAETASGFNLGTGGRGFYGLDRAAYQGDRALLQVQQPYGDRHSLFEPLPWLAPGEAGPGPVVTQLVQVGAAPVVAGDGSRLEQLQQLLELGRGHLSDAAELRRSLVGDSDGYGEFDEQTRAQMEALGYIDGE
ncbi:MAG: sulfatase [Planctomycetota bacterium]|nr:sulfatase [Planctomycetota bacterium]